VQILLKYFPPSEQLAAQDIRFENLSRVNAVTSASQWQVSQYEISAIISSRPSPKQIGLIRSLFEMNYLRTEEDFRGTGEE